MSVVTTVRWPKWRTIPPTSSPVPKGLRCEEGSSGLCHMQPPATVTKVSRAFPVSGKEGEHRAGLEWPGSALPSEVWEAICLLYQLSSPTHLSVAIRHDLFMLPHWQLPDTVSQTSLEANYHANCQRQKTWPDCCPTSTPAYKSFLNKTAQNKQSTTLMQLQFSRETICPRSYHEGTNVYSN